MTYELLKNTVVVCYYTNEVHLYYFTLFHSIISYTYLLIVMFTTKYLDLIVVYKNIERKQDRKIEREWKLNFVSKI